MAKHLLFAKLQEILDYFLNFDSVNGKICYFGGISRLRIFAALIIGETSIFEVVVGLPFFGIFISPGAALKLSEHQFIRRVCREYKRVL